MRVYFYGQAFVYLTVVDKRACQRTLSAGNNFIGEGHLKGRTIRSYLCTRQNLYFDVSYVLDKCLVKIFCIGLYRF